VLAWAILRRRHDAADEFDEEDEESHDDMGQRHEQEFQGRSRSRSKTLFAST
jgi:hypothetical protein